MTFFKIANNELELRSGEPQASTPSIYICVCVWVCVGVCVLIFIEREVSCRSGVGWTCFLCVVHIPTHSRYW